jgi:HEPN domain-containing protein
VELINPLAVIEDFFNALNLQEYREQLEEWLENGLSNQSADKWMESSKIIAVYENLQKLYGAAWLIYQRLSDDPYLKHDKTITDVANTQLSSELPAAPSLYKLNTVITADQHEQITQIVTIIKERAPSVQAVIYLGVPSNDQAAMYLLVLTDNNEQGLAQEISNHLEESCKKVANVFILVHHAASLITATDEKNLFLKKAAGCPVIYLSGGLILPKQKETDHQLVTEVSFRKWQRWQSQSLEFLKGAEYYLTIGAHNAALFSLSQTAECLLVAIIRLVTLYEINTHNLERLLKLTQMFTADISAIFELDDMEKKKLFNILKGAYVDVRYRDRYESDAASVAALYPLVKQMSTLLDQLSQKHLLASTL